MPFSRQLQPPRLARVLVGRQPTTKPKRPQRQRRALPRVRTPSPWIRVLSQDDHRENTSNSLTQRPIIRRENPVSAFRRVLINHNSKILEDFVSRIEFLWINKESRIAGVAKVNSIVDLFERSYIKMLRIVHCCRFKN